MGFAFRVALRALRECRWRLEGYIQGHRGPRKWPLLSGLGFGVRGRTVSVLAQKTKRNGRNGAVWKIGVLLYSIRVRAGVRVSVPDLPIGQSLSGYSANSLVAYCVVPTARWHPLLPFVNITLSLTSAKANDMPRGRTVSVSVPYRFSVSDNPGYCSGGTQHDDGIQ
jgi:hypothetical protein